VLLVLGLVGGGYGLLRLLDLGWDNTRAALVWLVGGVVLHDGVLAPLTMAVALVALRILPRERLAPFVVGIVILIPVTLVAIPELGRFGTRADNPTLLDRHYWLGWAGLVTLVVVAVAAASVVTSVAAARRRTPDRGGDDGTRDGGR
jgi:hypothetical protein